MIVSILLNGKDTGTLKAHKVRGPVGTFPWVLGFSSPGFWVEIEGHLGFADQGGLQ